MPKNNGDARKAERKQWVALRLIETNESGTTVEERERARGFTTGKRWKLGNPSHGMAARKAPNRPWGHPRRAASAAAAEAPDAALGRCPALLQCHREMGHAGGHEAHEENRDA
jgi:hypothetical protein